MKKQFNWVCLWMFTSIAFISPLLAQDIQKESLAAKIKYENAYNKKDVKTLVAMFTEDAIISYNDGRVYSGSEAIRAALAWQFTADSIKTTIKLDKAETVADGSVITTGTYHVFGEAEPGKKIDVKGSYTNTSVKVKETWKILKSELVEQ